MPDSNPAATGASARSPSRSPRLLRVAGAISAVGSCDAFSPRILRRRGIGGSIGGGIADVAVAVARRAVDARSSRHGRSPRFASSPFSRPFVMPAKKSENDSSKMMTMTPEGMDRIFDAVDVDGSGAIDPEEYNLHLLSAGYSEEAIRKSFSEIDADGNGEITRDELRSAILSNLDGGVIADCPMGYWLDSVRRQCRPLGPLGRVSQRMENLGPLKGVYTKITNVFGVDREALRRRGVPFLLAYSIISNLNGALSLSVAWYMTVKRTGLSPMVPGQKKSLLASYAMIYGALQVLKPFRVAAAVATSKLSADYLEMTQERLNCSRNVAVGVQFAMGQAAMGITFYVGVTVVSLLTGVPIWG